MVEYPVEFKDGYTTVKNRYNTAAKFNIKATYADGMELTIRDDTSNGILFEETKGRIFVNRGKLVGKPAEDAGLTSSAPLQSSGTMVRLQPPQSGGIKTHAQYP